MTLFQPIRPFLALFSSVICCVACVGAAIAQPGSVPVSATPSTDSLNQEVKFQKTFAATAGTTMGIMGNAAPSIHVSGWNRAEISVEIKAKGPYLHVDCRQEQGGVVLVANCGQPGLAALVRGTILVRVPHGIVLQIRTDNGSVLLDAVQGSVAVTLAKGSVMATGLNGHLMANLREGKISLLKSSLEGNASLQQGDIQIREVTGRFGAVGPSGTLYFEGKGAGVSADMAAGRLSVTTRGGDLQVNSYRADMDVQLKQAPADKADKVNLQAIQGTVTLRLPPKIDAQVQLQQTFSGTEPGGIAQGGLTPTVFESDFGATDTKAAAPAGAQTTNAKVHGRNVRIVSSRQTIGSGRHQINIVAADGRVMLKKL